MKTLWSCLVALMFCGCGIVPFGSEDNQRELELQGQPSIWSLGVGLGVNYQLPTLNLCDERGWVCDLQAKPTLAEFEVVHGASPVAQIEPVACGLAGPCARVRGIASGIETITFVHRDTGLTFDLDVRVAHVERVDMRPFGDGTEPSPAIFVGSQVETSIVFYGSNEDRLDGLTEISVSGAGSELRVGEACFDEDKVVTPEDGCLSVSQRGLMTVASGIADALTVSVVDASSVADILLVPPLFDNVGWNYDWDAKILELSSGVTVDALIYPLDAEFGEQSGIILGNGVPPTLTIANDSIAELGLRYDTNLEVWVVEATALSSGTTTATALWGDATFTLTITVP